MEDLKTKINLTYDELKHLKETIKSETTYEDTVAWIEKHGYSKDEALNRIYKNSNTAYRKRKALRRTLLNEEVKNDSEKQRLEKRYCNAINSKYIWDAKIDHVYKYFLEQYRTELIQKTYKENIVKLWMKCKYDSSIDDEIYVSEIDRLIKEYEQQFGYTKMLKYETQRMAIEGKHYI